MASATLLMPMGTFKIGTADYSAGNARTLNTFHLVRKQYFDNLVSYSYAIFTNTTFDAFTAHCATPDTATWLPYPYSEYDYALLVAPLVNPLVPSTTSGPVATAAGSTTDVTPVVNAVAAGNVILSNMLAGQSTPGGRATETTLAKVLAALAGTLTVGVSGQISIANFPTSFNVGNLPAKYWQDTQPVSGTFWQATQPVSLATAPLAAHAATDTLQTAGNGLLTDVKGLLGGPLTFTLPTGAATEATLPKLLTQTLTIGLPAGASTATKQDTGNGLLADMKAALLTPTIAAGAATTANQLIGNTSAASIDTKLSNVATAALQGAGNTTLASILAALGPAATAALQTAGNGTLASILAAFSPLSTATKQDALASLQATANSYLQVLAQTGVSVTSSLSYLFSLVTANGNNATSIRVGATWLLGGTVTNTASGLRYLLLYNAATAPSGTPPAPVLTVAIAAGATVSLPVASGRYVAFPAGLAMAAATASTISTITATVAGVTGSVGLTAGDLIINLTYAY